VLLPPRQFEPEVPRTEARWNAVGHEAAALLSQYIAVNTTNPPGNELKAAGWTVTGCRDPSSCPSANVALRVVAVFPRWMKNVNSSATASG
jgi:hypothetical protein